MSQCRQTATMGPSQLTRKHHPGHRCFHPDCTFVFQGNTIGHGESTQSEPNKLLIMIRISNQNRDLLFTGNVASGMQSAALDDTLLICTMHTHTHTYTHAHVHEYTHALHTLSQALSISSPCSPPSIVSLPAYCLYPLSPFLFPTVSFPFFSTRSPIRKHKTLSLRKQIGAQHHTA